MRNMKNIPFTISTGVLFLHAIYYGVVYGAPEHIVLFLIFVGIVVFSGLLFQSRVFVWLVRHYRESGIFALLWISVTLLSGITLVSAVGTVLRITKSIDLFRWDIVLYFVVAGFVSALHGLFAGKQILESSNKTNGTE